MAENNVQAVSVDQEQIKLEHDARFAHELAQAGELDKAWEICERNLFNHPNDPRLLVLASYIFDKSGKLIVAYQLAKRSALEGPWFPESWINVGKMADNLWLVSESESAYKKAIKLIEASKTDPDRRKKNLLLCHVNLAGLYVNVGRFQEGESHALHALRIDPESGKAKGNLGIAQLARRDWANGWNNYSYLLGAPTRKIIRFGNEPEWDGSPGKVVAIAGEQGMGDEISFASMIPDAIRDCGKVIVECDKRLTGLFQRSFPDAKVYGTRAQKLVEWNEEDQKMDASIMSGELGKFYRNTPDSFTGLPYLNACPDRSNMWRSLFDSKKKPCIGIAWTGGVQHTGSKFRQFSLEQLLPILKSIDAHWVSLQYKDASKEIAEHNAKHPEQITQYPYATLTKDYDDTAALVSQLDMVICMQTAVAHLAGALGVPCWVFVPKNSQWRYGTDATDIPWYKSVKVYRERNGWSGVIQKASQDLKSANFRRIP